MFRTNRKGGNDSKFFSSSKKGENHELREELRSPQRDRKRDAVKKVFPQNSVLFVFNNIFQVIANMTIGKDVSTLFTDVINCIQTGWLNFPFPCTPNSPY